MKNEFRFFYKKGLVIMKKIIAVAAALILALTATISLAGIVVSTKGAATASLQNMSGEDILGGSGEGGLDLGGITDTLGDLGGMDLGGVGDMLGGLDLGGMDLGGIGDMLGGIDLGGMDLGGITDMLGGFDLGGMLGGLGGDFDIGSIVDTVSGLVGGSSSSEDNTTKAPETTTSAPETTTQAPDTTAPSNVNTGD